MVALATAVQEVFAFSPIVVVVPAWKGAFTGSDNWSCSTWIYNNRVIVRWKTNVHCGHFIIIIIIIINYIYIALFSNSKGLRLTEVLGEGVPEPRGCHREGSVPKALEFGLGGGKQTG